MPQSGTPREHANGASDKLKATLIQTINNTDFKVGEVVWAPLGKQVYPAQIAEPSVLDCEGIAETVTEHKDAKEGFILVHFFDRWNEACNDATKRSYAWISAGKVKKYLEHIGFEKRVRTELLASSANSA